MQPWTTLKRELVLSDGRYLTVEKHTVQLGDGRVLPEWYWLITPDYVNAVVMRRDGQLLFFRQTKYAVPGTSLAPLGGYLDPGEEPLAGARRELLEEMGCLADDWLALGSFVVDGNRGAGHAHLFLARGAHEVAAPNSDDLEEQELLALTPAQARAALARGEFKVLSWATAVALALDHLDDVI